MYNSLNDWFDYNSVLHCPKIFIEWAWYGAVSAALSRRVWTGDINANCVLPSLQIITAGPPAVGKSLANMTTRRFLQSLTKISDDGKSADQRVCILADNITYQQALVRLTTVGVGTFNYANELHLYQAGSFILDELSALLTKDSKQMVELILTLSQGGAHAYDTKKNGTFVVTNPTITILAGTTPMHLSDMSKMGLFQNGFTSRMIFVWDDKNQWDQAIIPDRSSAQHEIGKDLRQHLIALTETSGKLHFNPQTIDWFNKFWVDWKSKTPLLKDTRLADYVGRRALHMQRLAMVLYMSEHTKPGEIPQSYLERAHEVLTRVEVNMPKAFRSSGELQEAGVQARVLQYIEANPGCDEVALLCAFLNDIDSSKLSTLILNYERTKAITIDKGKFYIKTP